MVSQELINNCLSFTKTLPHINPLQNPRWVLNNDCDSYEIHVFSDAFQRAYGACLYIHSVIKLGNITVNLLTSKSKVALIKPTIVPPLELCGALSAARLYAKVIATFTIPIVKSYFWSDSTIVLVVKYIFTTA